MAKERAINPAQAQRKADKQKEIARSKKQHQAQRNEKLARRNPERVQRQIDDLKTLEERSGLRPQDRENLAQLEKDLRGIKRAREALGEKEGGQGANHHQSDEKRDVRQDQRERRNHLGKRRRDEQDARTRSLNQNQTRSSTRQNSTQDNHSDDGSETDPEVRRIPMPRDTPPPIPDSYRARRVIRDPQIGPNGKRVPHALPAKPGSRPSAPAQTTYSSAPQIRDLKREAVRFLPTAVAQQKSRVSGQGKLLEPEEIDRLEKAGYLPVKPS